MPNSALLSKIAIGDGICSGFKFSRPEKSHLHRRQLLPHTPGRSFHSITPAASSASSSEELPYFDEEPPELPTWCYDPEADPFSTLGDRCSDTPLALPRLPPGSRRRLILVRHGQSTWNARNRIQGSSDFSVLTEEGMRQAEGAAALLEDWKFDCMFASPLKRAAETSKTVWGARPGPITVLPGLREIDLYSFQGMNKASGRAARPQEYEVWQMRPAEFIIDGHRPVHELWYRASAAWRDMLSSQLLRSCGLVVAHNAVNQALVATALGLPPTYFRRLTQTNAAFSVVDFQWPRDHGPNDDGKRRPWRKPRVTVQRFNHFPDAPAVHRSRATDRLVLIASGNQATVDASLRVMARCGVEGAPLVAVGPIEAQAADVLTALQATLGTPRPAGGRSVIAVAAPGACHAILDACLGVVGVGRNFKHSPGGVTIINYLRNADKVEQGTILCTNYDAAGAVNDD